MEELFDVIKRLRIAGFSFGMVLLAGTLGYYYIGGPSTSMVDAFYMTSITVATIGFHEVVDLSGHPYGRLFTVFLAFSGFGVLTYFLSNLIALFIEGDIRKTFKRNKMKEEISKLKDHYIICGCGRVGRNIAYELFATNRPMIITDMQEDILEELIIDIPGTPYISGDSTEDEFLSSLGLADAQGLFVVTGDDNTNLVISLTARQLNPTIRIVAVSKNINHVKKMELAGANKVITPTYIGGLRAASEMLRPTVTLFMDEMLRSDFKERLEEMTIPKNYDQQPLEKLPLDQCEQTIILALKSNGKWHYNPKKNHLLNDGDKLIVMTTPEERSTLEKHLTRL